MAASARAVAGEQLLMLVTGEPGIGKTQADRRDRTRVRRGRAISCSTAGGTRSRCVRPRHFAKHSAVTRCARPEGLVRTDVGALAPVLGRIVPEVLEGQSGTPGRARRGRG